MFPPNAMASRARRQSLISSRRHLSVLAAAALSVALTAATSVKAEEVLLSSGDAVVTGFAGIKPSEMQLPENANPLDHFFIDLDGPSVKIMSLQGLGGAPVGQRITPSIKREVKAGEVGQVFAIAIDDAEKPNVYLGATSAFGIQIVGPDKDGNGEADRIRKGATGAAFMPGQFGPGPDGNPGTIWRVDGATGNATAFATLPGNTGPGIGDIVYDARSKHFYASDLDTGIIHRIDSVGILVDSFDHGVEGRPNKDMEAVADNGNIMNIENPAFDSENSDTWGFTQSERMVYGMAIHDGRLYYAVAGDQQVWSIGLTEEGSFAGDARWELDVTDLPGAGPITDITFSASNMMFLAQRGKAKGSYNYGEYADASNSIVLRYRKEEPNDPETDGVWVSVSDSYSIGLPEKHLASNGGIALGFAHDEYGNLKTAQPDGMLWTSGERLRPGTNEEDAESDLHGLQGAEAVLVVPQNTPPQSSYFADFDGYFDDASKSGHMGDVEIWQPSGKYAEAPPAPDTPPGYFPPEYTPPDDTWDDTPWDPTPPEEETPGKRTTNLKLTKTSLHDKCFDIGVAWRCVYDVNVQNTSATNAFNGLVRVKDQLPSLPIGSTIGIPETPPWTCNWITAPHTFACRQVAFLAPGASVSFTVNVNVPKTANTCSIKNIAEITHANGGTWRNTDPVDDIDSASALIPNPGCETIDETNLQLRKTSDPGQCGLIGGELHCRFRIEVENMGPGKFVGPLQIQDDPMAGATAEFTPAGDWSGGCAAAGGGYLCTHSAANVELVKNQSVDLWSLVKVPFDVAVANGCTVPNAASIVTPLGGLPLNTNAADDSAGAVATVPAGLCALPVKLKAATKRECPAGFAFKSGSCKRIGPDKIVSPPKPGPQCKSGWDRFARRADVPSSWKKYRSRRNGKTIWCAQPRRDTSGPRCEAGWDRFALRKQIPGGWTRKRVRKNGKSVWCAKPPVKVERPQCRYRWKEFASKNRVPSGWKSYTTAKNGIRIWCGLPQVQPQRPQCRSGWQEFPSKKRVPRGWKSYSTAKNGIRIWCGKSQIEVGPTCKTGYRQYSSRKSIPRGYKWYTTKSFGLRIWCAKKGTGGGDGQTGPGPKCPKTHRTFRSSRSVPKGWVKYRVSKNGQTIWCAIKVNVDFLKPKCRSGWKKFPNQASIPSGWQKEKRKKFGQSIWCGRKPSGGGNTGSSCKRGWKQYSSSKSIPRGYQKYSTYFNGRIVWCGRRGNTHGTPTYKPKPKNKLIFKPKNKLILKKKQNNKKLKINLKKLF